MLFLSESKISLFSLKSRSKSNVLCPELTFQFVTTAHGVRLHIIPTCQRWVDFQGQSHTMLPDQIKQFAGAFCRAPAGPETGPWGDQKLALPQKAIAVGGERSSRGQGSDNRPI